MNVITPPANYSDSTAQPEAVFIWLVIFILLFVILIVFISIYFPYFHKSNQKNHLTRSARLSDIIVSQSAEFNLFNYFRLTSEFDIDNLEIRICFLDSSSHRITNKLKHIGNVKSGQEYKFVFSNSDFELPQIDCITQWQVEEISGTVSILA